MRGEVGRGGGKFGGRAGEGVGPRPLVRRGGVIAKEAGVSARARERGLWRGLKLWGGITRARAQEMGCLHVAVPPSVAARPHFFDPILNSSLLTPCRSTLILQLDRCTLVLKAVDFVQLYLIAAQGSAWQSVGSPLTQVWGLGGGGGLCSAWQSVGSPLEKLRVRRDQGRG